MLIDNTLHGVRDRLLALRTMPNYAGLDDESLLYIAEHARERRFAAGEALFVESEPFTRMHFLIHGRVATARQGKPHQVVEAPGAVGVLAALARESDGWGATAEVDTLTLEIPADAFMDNLEEDFSLLRNSLRILAGRVLARSGNLPLRPASAPAVVVGEPPDRDPTLGELVVAMRANTRATPFANANMDALIEMVRLLRIQRVPAGETLFEVGDAATFSFRILHGRIRCTAASGEHVDVGPGMSLGSLDGFAGRARSYTARTETFVIGHRGPFQESLAVLEMYPGLAMSILRDLARGLVAA